MSTQKQVLLKNSPRGWVQPSDMEVASTPFDLAAVGNNAGDIVRGRMNVGAESYSASWQLNKPCQTFSVSKVIKSNNPAFAVGDHVSGPTGWEVYTVTDGKSGTNKIQEIPGVPISIYLGVLGGPGLTAYIGLHHFCSPMKPGETLYVNAAAGAVGTVVGQIGKAIGLRVVGSAGSDDKVKLLKELGFDEAFNYKTGSLDENLKRTCPNGIDIYFDNVGGEHSDTVYPHLNNFARVPVCGWISEYNTEGKARPLHNLNFNLIVKRLRVQGFIVTDHIAQYMADFQRDMIPWITQGKIKVIEDVRGPIDVAPEYFVSMLKGGNTGKAVVRVAA